MFQNLRRHLPIVITAVVTATVFAAGPTVAQAAFDAVNADKVDGKHAVGAAATPAARAGKLVATNGSGRLPNNIIAKAPDANMLDGKDSTQFLGSEDTAWDSDKLDGQDSTAFAPNAHDHDDRYYPKPQTQARTAPNSLSCAAGQYLRSVAADGTPTCGVDAVGTTMTHGMAGSIGTKPAGATFTFAGPTVRVTTTTGQTVLTSVSGVIGTTATSVSVDFTICRAPVGGSLIDTTGGNYLTTNLTTNQQKVISTTFSSQPAAGTYDYGLCVRSGGGDLNLNDYVNGAVTVFN